MPLSLLLTVCLAIPGSETPHCDVRAMYAVDTSISLKDCSIIAQRKADEILLNARREYEGSDGEAIGKCFPQDQYSGRIVAIDKFMSEHGYTFDFTTY